MGWNWPDLGKLVARYAPALGMALGGTAGRAVGASLASLFGVQNEPDAIAAAVRADPEAAIKLRALETEHHRQITAMILADEADARATRQAHFADVNATMRAELVATSGYRAGWRPLLGYIVGVSIGGVFAGLIYALFKYPEKADEIVANATAVLVVALGVLGYNSRQRSRDKEVAAGVKPQGLVEQIFTKGER